MENIKKKKFNAILALLISGLFCSIAVILVRIQANVFTGAFMAFFRFGCGVIFCIIFLAFPGNRENRKIYNPRALVARGVVGALGITLFFLSIELIGSSRATLLLNTFPIWVALLSLIIFKEKIKLIHWVAIILCVSGAVFIFGEKTDFPLVGAIIGIAAGCTRGAAIHLIKITVAKNHPVIVYLSVCLFGLFLFPFVVSEFSLISSWETVIMLIAIAFLMFAYQVFLAWGLRYLAPTTGSILIYSSIPFTLALGFLIDEHLKPIAWIGAALIVIGVLFPIFFHKRKDAGNSGR